MKNLAVACLMALAIATARSAAPPGAPRGAVAPPPLRVAGNVLKTPSGEVVRLEGVNVPSLEWSNTGDEKLPRSIEVAMTDWNANSIRLPLSQDRWFGHAEGQSDGGAAYRAIVDRAVQAVAGHCGYAILDLHWSDAGEWGKNIAQHWMPDQNSVTFWKDAARRYANHPAVLFDLYNEPHDVSWDVWRNGGAVHETGNDKTWDYETPGMQGLLEAVRSTGAKNAVIAGGLDWAYDLSGVVRGYALKDPKGNGILYGTHIYPWKGDWDGKVAVIADRYPVYVGEVGCEPDPRQEDPNTWAPKVLAFIGRHRFNWAAWCFHPDASPRMLQDWSYAPTPYWGKISRDALKSARRPKVTPPK